jgi:hypothetical protein
VIEIRTQSNIDRIRLQFANMTGGMEEKATIRALNRAGDQSVTAASREIRRVYNISAGRARQQIKVRNRAQHGKLYFTIRIFSRRIPLIEFGARQTKRGVTVAVRKGARKLIPHAFITTMGSGHRGVFVRAYGGKGNPVFRFGRGSGMPERAWGDPDLPITELTSLTIPRMFLERSVRSAVARVAMDSFTRNFEQQMKFLSQKAA